MTLDLLATLRIVDDDVTAVVNAYLADPSCGTNRFGEWYRIDSALAVAQHPSAGHGEGHVPWSVFPKTLQATPQ